MANCTKNWEKKLLKLVILPNPRPGRMSAGGRIFVQIAQISTFSFQKCEKTARLSGFS
jgi:hypothetical protein